MGIAEMKMTVLNVIRNLKSPFTMDFLFYYLNHHYLIQNHSVVKSVINSMIDGKQLEYYNDPVSGWGFRNI